MLGMKIRTWFTGLIALALAGVLLGCPPIEPPNGTFPPINGDPQVEYDEGFEDGFHEDDWYWAGYWDGFDTVDFEPIYYDDSDIPFVESPPYEAGFWDGVWYAYNDGYFVDYHYAFILGFSEGYDSAYAPDFLDFLETDQHTEYLHGGWIDGYNDGFSEGRVFGAFDRKYDWPFDWEDALLDYELGTDIYEFEDIGVVTGPDGPVILYEYGVNPHDIVKRSDVPDRLARSGQQVRSIRGEHSLSKSAKSDMDSMYRAFIQEAREELDVRPDKALRGDRELRLETTWLERIEDYLAFTSGAKQATEDRVSRSTFSSSR